MKKWEYCVITGVNAVPGSFLGYHPKLSFFSKSGISKEVDLGNSGSLARPKGWEKVKEGEYIAFCIASLGLDGWEMVGVGNSTLTNGSGGYQCIYFRRLIE